MIGPNGARHLSAEACAAVARVIPMRHYAGFGDRAAVEGESRKRQHESITTGAPDADAPDRTKPHLQSKQERHANSSARRVRC